MALLGNGFFPSWTEATCWVRLPFPEIALSQKLQVNDLFLPPIWIERKHSAFWDGHIQHITHIGYIKGQKVNGLQKLMEMLLCLEIGNVLKTSAVFINWCRGGIFKS